MKYQAVIERKETYREIVMVEADTEALAKEMIDDIIFDHDWTENALCDAEETTLRFEKLEENY